jgi:hypothetical protein
MGSSPRRWVQRGSLVAAALCCTLAASMPVWAQEEAPAGAPEVWRGAAKAAVAVVDVNRDALLPVEGVFRFVALDGDSVYDTDLQTARASLFYPGEGVIQGPNLACGTFGNQFPPEFKPVLDACVGFDYPLSVRADASKSDASTDGSTALGQPTDPVSAEAVGAIAHAALDGSWTKAQLADLKVLGFPGVSLTSVLPVEDLVLDPSILRIGSATSRTDQRIGSGGLVTTATSELSGVRLVGGLVRIGSIVSTSTATDDGAGKRTSAADIEVSGVTVAGFPAQITEDGLVLGSPGGLGPIRQQVQQAANQLLASLGVRISLLDNVEEPDDGTGLARAQAPGVLLEVKTRADGAPPVPGPLGDIDLNGEYIGTIQLGASGASAGATSFEDEVIAPIDPAFDQPVVGGEFVPSDLSTPDASAAEPPAAPPSDPSSEPSQQYLKLVVDRFGGRMGLLYLAFAFTVLGLCLVPRLTLPARLPGVRP